MSEWKEYRLGDVASIRSGYPFKSIDLGDTGFPVIKIGNVRHPIIDMSETERVNEDVIMNDHRAKEFEVFAGDILVSMTGNVGIVGRVPKLRERTFVNQRVGKVEVIDKEKLSKQFLYYWLSLPEARTTMEAAAHGSVQPNLAPSHVEELRLLLPPLPEQRAIASVLSSLDDKIDLLHRQNKTLEALAETLFRQWFVEQDTQRGKVDDLIEILPGFAFQSKNFVESGKYRLVTIKNVQDGILDLSRTDYLENVPETMPAYCFLERGDILLSLTGNVGRCCLVTEDGLLLNQRVAKVKPRADRDFAFAYIFFRTNSTRIQLEELAKGTAQANLSPIETRDLEMPFPSTERLQSFAEQANPLIEKVLGNSYHIRTLTQMRDTLLPKLMSREVRVKSEK